MKFETENLELLENHGAKKSHNNQSRVKNYSKVLALLAAVTIAYFLLGGATKTQTAASISVIPQLMMDQGSSLKASVERTLFVSGQLSKMIGDSPISEFHNIPTVFARYLQFEQSTMSSTDKYFSQEILDIMRLYQSHKVNGAEAVSVFFSKLDQIFDFNAELLVTSENASGKQLEFWQNAKKNLAMFATPQWINKKGETVSKHGEIISKTVNFDQTNYFTEIWGPIAVTKDEKLMSQQSVAPTLLNRSYFFFEGAEEIPENAPEKDSAAFKYLNLFATLRLAHQMTEQDNYFAKAIELLIVDWLKSVYYAQDVTVSHYLAKLNNITSVRRIVESNVTPKGRTLEADAEKCDSLLKKIGEEYNNISGDIAGSDDKESEDLLKSLQEDKGELKNL